MSNAQDALKDFESTGTVQDVKPATMAPTPSIRLHDEEGKNVGKYIVGKYLGRREADGPNGKLVFLDIRLVKTNQVATVKKDGKYPETEVKAGDLISLFASSRLDRAIKTLDLGSEVFVVYDGMARVKGKKGMVWAHTYTVKAKAGTLSPEDKEYVSRRSDNAASKEDAAKAKSANEAEAQQALSTIED